MCRLFMASPLLLFVGCGWFSQHASSSPNRSTAQAIKRDTIAGNKIPELELHDLATRLEKAESKNAEAEKEIARLEEELAVDGRARSTGQGRGGGNGIVRAVGLRGRSSLRRLAQRHVLLDYDDDLTACRLAKPLTFEPGGTQLTPQSQWVLNDFSKLLATDDAIDYRVVLIGRGRAGQGGHASPHVNTVARYLTEEGLADHRLGILTTGGADATVDVYLLGSDRLTVGWDDQAERR